MSVDDLDDYEVLDLKTRQVDFQLEFRELIDKVSSFETFVLPLGDLAADLRVDVLEIRDGSKKILDVF